MIRRPPRSTLFPYRRSSDLLEPLVRRVAAEARSVGGDVIFGVATDQLPAGRSEEHTSELQSRRDLVCRLLLEKKKKWQIVQMIQVCSSVPLLVVLSTTKHSG